MRRKLSIAIVIFVFLLGFCLFMYPTVSNLWNEHLNGRLIDEYEDAVEGIGNAARQQMLEDARLYNTYMNNPEKLGELGLDYDELLDIYSTGVMGYIEIPKISESLVIYHHTETGDLQKGVGHIDTTSLPVGGAGTHAAIAGHRGLPSAKLFTYIDQLEIDDVFYIHILDETLKYRVDDISVVLPDEMSKLRAVAGKDYVTLVTCTPYGVNSHRLLVRGVRDEDDDDGYEILHTPNEISDINPIYLVPIAMVALVAMVFAVTRIRQKLGKRK